MSRWKSLSKKVFDEAFKKRSRQHSIETIEESQGIVGDQIIERIEESESEKKKTSAKNPPSAQLEWIEDFSVGALSNEETPAVDTPKEKGTKKKGLTKPIKKKIPKSGRIRKSKTLRESEIEGEKAFEEKIVVKK